MSHVTEIFGTNVFDDDAMRERLPKDAYRALKRTIEEGAPLGSETAAVVASAMKEWAVERGATHYCHWFQPMTGITAEKHDAFITPHPGGRVIMEFSGKELVRGESDASSFPSGGLRNTFEARGYTTWDATSSCFVKNTTLYIPTAFCSYSGEALDKKTPLLRSMAALGMAALRLLKLFGNTTSKRVISTLGVEQEYFLIDRAQYLRRRDLIFSGRTLFGTSPPKGQQMDDHYYGHIKERILAYMKDVDEELWRLGIHAKTRHNEAAPAQHELALIYDTANVATDHNQLVMETLKTIATRHGLACLLHEKPFEGINGSGKHNNWGLSTDDGINLLDPGKAPHENTQFLVFLCAVIKAVDMYAELIRLSVATYSNDCRLGGFEAPPSVVSIYLGDELTMILEAIGRGKRPGGKISPQLEMGVSTLPSLEMDTTDRNRTSPFAFTGNRFEFRMPGSAMSMSGPNIILNTIVAETLSDFADVLEKAADFDEAVSALLRDTVREHGRVLFDGNNYSKEWSEEAARRGLPCLRTSVDALPHYLDKKSIDVFEKHHVFSEAELRSRCDIYLENYIRTAWIEAETMVEMAKREILPAVIRYSGEVLSVLEKKRALGIADAAERAVIGDLSDYENKLCEATERLVALLALPARETAPDRAAFCRDELIPAMKELRRAGDLLETVMSRGDWPYPTYGDLLFEV
ncbi:glutamine synthetase III [Oscillospiraceae bacterium OttesenSCG-928-F05]|nr:glutamine synthetase III [Oscillospiraceae bacterium OttesenSCG-928-F05]